MNWGAWTNAASVMAIAIAACVIGCGGEGAQLSPVEVLKSDELPDAGLPPEPIPDAGGDAGAPEVVRTVETRSPFGDLDGNLLADGDFELSVSEYGGQYGWRAFTSSGTAEVALKVETGGLCKSGLRCVLLDSKTQMFATGVAAPAEEAHVASLWFKPPAGEDCASLRAVTLDCETFHLEERLVSTGHVDDRGWCELAVEAPGKRSGVCLYVEALYDGGFGLLDAASVRPKTLALRSARGPAPSPEAWVPSAELVEHVSQVGELIRKTRPFGRVERRTRMPASEE